MSKFILSPEEMDKKEKESLKIARKNVIFTEEEFRKVLEHYDNK